MSAPCYATCPECSRTYDNSDEYAPTFSLVCRKDPLPGGLYYTTLICDWCVGRANAGKLPHIFKTEW